MVNIPKGGHTRFIPANEKIFDATEADVAAHICSIATKVPPNCVAVLISCERQSGSGDLGLYPNEGAHSVAAMAATSEVILLAMKDKGQAIKYAVGVANDDWDLWMVGYFVEGPAE